MKTKLQGIALLAGALTRMACNGWPDANDVRQAQTKPEKYQTYAATQGDQQTIVFENRRYVVTPAPVDLHDAKLQSVGSADGVSIYAPEGEQAPYSVLYTPVSGTMWRRVQPIE